MGIETPILDRLSQEMEHVVLEAYKPENENEVKDTKGVENLIYVGLVTSRLVWMQSKSRTVYYLTTAGRHYARLLTDMKEMYDAFQAMSAKDTPNLMLNKTDGRLPPPGARYTNKEDT